jgi:hypothetical protein
VDTANLQWFNCDGVCVHRKPVFDAGFGFKGKFCVSSGWLMIQHVIVKVPYRDRLDTIDAKASMFQTEFHKFVQDKP